MKSFFLNKIVYYIAGLAAVLFVISYFFPPLYQAGNVVLIFLGISLLVDILLVYSKNGIEAARVTQSRWSNGDENKVVVQMKNHYTFPVTASVIDELPFQFQERNWLRKLSLSPGGEHDLVYTVRPVERGEYAYGDINIFINSPLRLVKRKYTIAASETIKVYPSYIQMRRYQLLAVSNRLQEVGVKRIRKIGHSMEFEQIKEYVRGDDYRTINWKATARKGGDLMVNNFTDERSQQIYCVINKGRVMKMPFDGMTLLDYAVNASLVLCNVALVKQDKAGLITFAENLDSFLVADKKPTQMNLVLESLYRQKTKFLESDFEKLYSVIRNRITHRSLVVMFTNFESLESLQREMPSLKLIARYHLLLVVLFENTELRQLQQGKAETMEDIYIKTIAEKFSYEKRQMVKELHANGIVAILSSPENLTVNTINKYLELKTRLSI